MLYTGKGDSGTTQLFDQPGGRRLSKSNLIFEALGTIDELNSSLGYAKSLAQNDKLEIDSEQFSYDFIIEEIQQNLFCIQAELGGAKISATKEHVDYLEKIISAIELKLPPITTFIVPGGCQSGAFLDFTRTIARRAERLIIATQESKVRIISSETIAYLNRLSSVLYALARFSNFQNGESENKPDYQ